MEKHLNDFDGFSYYLSSPAEIEQLDNSAAILLEPGQIDFFRNYPKSLEQLIKKAAPIAEIPNLAKWLASLWNKPLTLEVHTTSDLYDLNAVWLRFKVREEDQEEGELAWKPAINLLDLRNSEGFPVPGLLRQVFAITGEINHNGYSIAGRLHHPNEIGQEVTFYETFYSDQAFYRLDNMAVYWEFHGGIYNSEEERREFGLYWFDEGLAYFLNQYFGTLLDEKELRIDRDGNIED